METFALRLQFANSPLDHQADAGAVAGDQLVSAFRNFPFEQELDRIPLFTPEIIPTVTFARVSHSEQLSISTKDNRLFDLELRTGDHAFFVQQQDKPQTEEIIEWFKNDKVTEIERRLIEVLEPAPEAKATAIEGFEYVGLFSPREASRFLEKLLQEGVDYRTEASGGYSHATKSSDRGLKVFTDANSSEAVSRIYAELFGSDGELPNTVAPSPQKPRRTSLIGDR